MFFASNSEKEIPNNDQERRKPKYYQKPYGQKLNSSYLRGISLSPHY